MLEKPDNNEPPLLRAITDQPPVPGLGDFVRLSGPPEAVAASLGPLADLVGTWVGNTGFNMVALPQGDGFLLLIQPYVETITFSALGAPVPNRRGAEGATLFVTGVHYDLHVSDAQTNQPLHLENGMWLFLGGAGAEPALEPPIARHSVIPHGDSLLAMGYAKTTDGPPDIPPVDGLPISGPETPPGYLDPYQNPPHPFRTDDVTGTLRDVVAQQKIVQTITLDVDTKTDGGILNIPFVNKNVDANDFKATFWIETVANEDGTTFQQLQYFQQTNFNFLPAFGIPETLILWPHTNVNTLVKQ
jgi:hypothetical protein